MPAGALAVAQAEGDEQKVAGDRLVLKACSVGDVEVFHGGDRIKAKATATTSAKAKALNAEVAEEKRKGREVTLRSTDSLAYFGVVEGSGVVAGGVVAGAGDAPEPTPNAGFTVGATGAGAAGFGFSCRRFLGSPFLRFGLAGFLAPSGPRLRAAGPTAGVCR